GRRWRGLSALQRRQLRLERCQAVVELTPQLIDLLLDLRLVGGLCHRDERRGKQRRARETSRSHKPSCASHDGLRHNVCGRAVWLAGVLESQAADGGARAGRVESRSACRAAAETEAVSRASTAGGAKRTAAETARSDCSA